MKIFLDDKREAPDSSWLLIRYVEDFFNLVRYFNGEIEEVSLDHDLGLFNELDGTGVINWLECELLSQNIAPFLISVHSANPVGAERMRKVAEKLNRLALE